MRPVELRGLAYILSDGVGILFADLRSGAQPMGIFPTFRAAFLFPDLMGPSANPVVLVFHGASLLGHSAIKAGSVQATVDVNRFCRTLHPPYRNPAGLVWFRKGRQIGRSAQCAVRMPRRAEIVDTCSRSQRRERPLTIAPGRVGPA